MKKRMIIMLVSMAVLFGAIFGFQMFKAYMIKKFLGGNKMPTVTVAAQSIHYQPWQSELTASASLRAVHGVDITSEVAGMVNEIQFKPGAQVKKGDILIVLNKESDVALLHSLQANAQLAQTVYERDKAQYEIEAISKATLDADAASLKSALAQVAQQKAIVDKKIIRAPFSGRLGISAVNLGQYINPGDNIVTLQTLDPIYADFYVPQQFITELKKDEEVVLNTNAYPNINFKGKITTINPKVDMATRNIQVEATVANSQAQLLPGMFATANVTVGKAKQYLTLPQTAISYNPYGDIAFIIKKAKKPKEGDPALTAMQTFVTTGEMRGNQVAVLTGLKKGDLIVTAGGHKLRNGSPVVINNTVLPSNEQNPTTIDE